jgi:hypothetical protein
MHGELNMKNLVKKLFGIDKLEIAKKQAEEELKTLEAGIANLQESTRVSGLTPKELATEKKEPYFKILDFHVNPENPRFGFFELDWNEYHVAYCRSCGYIGDNDEAIVDSWFTDYCKQIAAQEGVNMDRRATGFINVNNLGNGKTEVS